MQLKCILNSFLTLCSAAILAQPLSGNYTIGTGGNYNTIQAAVNDLSTKGIAGAVTFNIANGIYAEAITFPQVAGNSNTQKITFRGSGNTVILPASTLLAGQVMWVVAGSNYAFRKIAFNASSKKVNRIINVHNNEAVSLSVDSCRFTGTIDQNNYTSYGVATQKTGTEKLKSIVVTTTVFDSIDYPISLDADVQTEKALVKQNRFNTTFYTVSIGKTDTVNVSENSFINYNEYGLICYECNRISVKDNIAFPFFSPFSSSAAYDISSSKFAEVVNNRAEYVQNALNIRDVLSVEILRNDFLSCGYPVFISNVNNYAEISNNTITSKAVALAVYDCMGSFTIYGNKILVDTGAVTKGSSIGIHFSNYTDTFNFTNVYNNIIEARDKGIQFNNSSSLGLYYNTIAMKGDKGATAFDITNSTELNVRNNLFYMDSLNANGDASDSVSVYNLENNTYFFANGNAYYLTANNDNVFARGNSTYNTFADYRAATANDSIHTLQNPLFSFTPYAYEPTNIAYAGNVATSPTNTIDIYGRSRVNRYPGAVAGGNISSIVVEASQKIEAIVYPNPGSNLLHIQTSGLETIEFALFDLQGKKLTEQSLMEAHIFSMDMSNYSTGLYLIKLSNASGVHSTFTWVKSKY